VKIVILSAVILLGAACSKGSSDSNNNAAKPPVAATSPNSPKSEIAAKTPEDWIVVQDKDYIPVIDDVSRKLRSARKAFMMKDPAAAATDVRATMDILSKETAGAASGLKENIDVATKQLNTLASDLDSKKTVGTKRFDAAIATANVPISNPTGWWWTSHPGIPTLRSRTGISKTRTKRFSQRTTRRRRKRSAREKPS